jgi:hypothetical protein
MFVLGIWLCLVACGSAQGPGSGHGRDEGVLRGDATWQYQLQGAVDTTVDAGTYDIDLFATSPETVEALQTSGRRVICYVNAGALETWRPDATQLPDEVRGERLDDWRGEYLLDIRRLDVLEPWLAARFDLCRDKGFDAVEPDNVDGYILESGFPLTAEDQLAFNRMLARLAHERGLAVGLKNDLDQVNELADDFDFAVNEQCVEYRECQRLAPFVERGKPVYHVEYDLGVDRFCPPAPGFRSIRKPLSLGPEVEPCPVRTS